MDVTITAAVLEQLVEPASGDSLTLRLLVDPLVVDLVTCGRCVAEQRWIALDEQQQYANIYGTSIVFIMAHTGDLLEHRQFHEDVVCLVPHKALSVWHPAPHTRCCRDRPCVCRQHIHPAVYICMHI